MFIHSECAVFISNKPAFNICSASSFRKLLSMKTVLFISTTINVLVHIPYMICFYCDCSLMLHCVHSSSNIIIVMLVAFNKVFLFKKFVFFINLINTVIRGHSSVSSRGRWWMLTLKKRSEDILTYIHLILADA